MGSNLNNQYSVFISYAHKDNQNSDASKCWLNRVLEILEPLIARNQIQVWADTDIEIGDDWHERIQTALQNAKAALLLVSPAYLASKYIHNSELPVLLKHAKNNGVIILPIILRPCLFQETKFKYPHPEDGPEEFSLSSLQAANSPTEPLNNMTEYQQDQVLLSVARRILKIIQMSGGTELPLAQSLATQSSPPVAGSLEHAPATPAKSTDNIDQIALRHALVQAFSLEELEILCAEIQTDLEKTGVTIQVSLEIVGGVGKQAKVLNLVQYLNRRGYLSYLVSRVRNSRPHII